MDTEGDKKREAITEFLQKNGPMAGEEPDCVVTGWALVMESIKPDGTRMLSRGWSNGNTSWGANGMFHEALYGDWDDD